MRHVITSILVAGCVSSTAVAFQARAGGAAAGAPAIRACSILTKDLVAPFAENKKVLDLIPPEEESLGNSGAACEWGIVRLQVFPTAKDKQKRTAPNKEYQPLSGVGEAAYFHNNKNNYAELMFWTATHYLTLQVSVPTGKTAEAIKPDTVRLANAIIAKLR
jgi:hypothetical protein